MARNYDYNGDPCGEYGAAVGENKKLREELARLRPTKEEREAIRVAADGLERDAQATGRRDDWDTAQVLRGLLERLK